MAIFNPLNIEHSRPKETPWMGLASVQDDPLYVAFTDMKYCYRAGTKIFQSYQARGINTPEHAIATWAPPEENPTDTYIDNMCAWCGVLTNQIVDFGDPTFMLLWLRGITRQEQGTTIAATINSDVIRAGIALALK